jgi:N-acetylglucosamine kinase-like BadF-type ATPase
MKLNTHIFITTVMKPLDITITTKIPNLLKNNVKEGIKRVLQLIRTRGFNVISMTTDGEFACLKEWTHSKGVIHEIVGAGSHVPD